MRHFRIDSEWKIVLCQEWLRLTWGNVTASWKMFIINKNKFDARNLKNTYGVLHLKFYIHEIILEICQLFSSGSRFKKKSLTFPEFDAYANSLLKVFWKSLSLIYKNVSLQHKLCAKLSGYLDCIWYLLILAKLNWFWGSNSDRKFSFKLHLGFLSYILI